VKKNPLDGITINGKALADSDIFEKGCEKESNLLADKISKEEKTSAKSSRKLIYHKPRDHRLKKDHGEIDYGRKLNMAEINGEYLETNLKAAQSIREGVVACLLTGKKLTAGEISMLISDRFKLYSNATAAAMYSINKTELGRLINKAPHRGHFIYQLIEPACHMSFKTALCLMLKSNKIITLRTVGTCTDNPKFQGVIDRLMGWDKEEEILLADEGPVKEVWPAEGFIEDARKRLSDVLGVDVKIDININIEFGPIGGYEK